MNQLETIRNAAKEATSREEMWARIVNAVQARSFAEVGVFRGHFAEQVLKDCESIDQYYMIDPWRSFR